MEAVTGLLGLALSLLAFVLPPVQAIIVFCAGLFLYPQRLTVELGTLDFTTGRIIILAVLANAMFRAKLLRDFKPNLVDLFYVMVFVGTSLAATTTMPGETVFERQGGIMFDTIFPYIALRLIMRKKEDYVTLMKGIAVIAVPLAIMGIYEGITGKNPTAFMTQYYSMGFAEELRPITEDTELWTNGKRMGIFRATGTFGIHISFGLFFAAVAPALLGLWKQAKVSHAFVVVTVVASLIGLYSSASSAPIFSIAISLAMLLFYPFRRAWPLLLAGLIVCMAYVEIYSNRHFYHVLTRLALNQETAYYRIMLFDQTFEDGGMNDHWLLGYGYVGLGPGTDNSNFPFFYRDLVNIYIFYLVRYGLFGLVPFLFLNVTYYRKIYLGGRNAVSAADKWLVWCFASSLVGWNIGMMTVGALSQTEIQFAMLMAICANLPTIMAAQAQGDVTNPVPAQTAYQRFRGGPRAPWKSRFQPRLKQARR